MSQTARSNMTCTPIPGELHQYDAQALPANPSRARVTAGQVVAWCRKHPDGALTDELLPDARIGEVRKASGVWIALAPMGRDQVATVTLSGHQLREALNLINPDGDGDVEQLDDELTFGVVQHEGDDLRAAVGMCCWNDDMDGVYPLTGDGPYAHAQNAALTVPLGAALG